MFLLHGLLFSAVASFAAASTQNKTFSSKITYSYSMASAGANNARGGTTNMTFTWSGASAGAQNSTGKTLFTFANAGGNGVPAYVTIDTTPLTYGSGNSMTGSVPIYVIYYTAVSNYYNWNTVGYFDANRQQAIANFINGLTASTYFSTVRQYSQGGIPGNVYLAGSYVMDCNRDYLNYGCDLSINNSQGSVNTDDIINGLIIRNLKADNACQQPTAVYCDHNVRNDCFCGFAPSSNAIYVILMGPETTEAFSNDGSGAKLGTDYCAYHTYLEKGGTQYKYIVAQVPNSASVSMPPLVMNSTSTKPPSSCFFGGVNSLTSATSPNGDAQLDYVIGHLAHEIIETLVSPVARQTYRDASENEVMDKCENWMSNLQSLNNGRTYNVQFGSSYFLLPAIWDEYTKSCVTGGTGELIKSQIRDNFCIDVSGGSHANGATLIAHDCHVGDNQRWTYNSQEQSLRVKHSGKCLDVPGGNGFAGQQVRQWDCLNNGAQKWIYNSVDRSIRWAGNLGLCLDVSGGGNYNGAPLLLWNCHGGVSQIWNVPSNVPSSFNVFPLRSVQQLIKSQIRNNFCIDVPGASNANELTLITWDCHSGANQRWTYNSQDQTIIVQHNGKCMNVPNNNGVAGQHVTQYDCNMNKSQKWIYNSVDRSIRWAGNLGLCLDVSGGSNQNGTPLLPWTCHGGISQIWNFASP